MANYTPNYNLALPLPQENYDIAVFNANTTKIDTALLSLKDSSGVYHGICSSSSDSNPQIVTTTKGDFSGEIGSLVFVTFENTPDYNEYLALSVDDYTSMISYGDIYGNQGFIVARKSHLFILSSNNTWELFNPNFSTKTIGQGVCYSSASASEKIVDLNTDGMPDIVLVRFNSGNTAENIILNVNGKAASVSVGMDYFENGYIDPNTWYMFVWGDRQGSADSWHLISPMAQPKTPIFLEARTTTSSSTEIKVLYSSFLPTQIKRGMILLVEFQNGHTAQSLKFDFGTLGVFNVDNGGQPWNSRTIPNGAICMFVYLQYGWTIIG
jgi:hypothetical protein